MGVLALHADERVKSVSFADERIVVDLMDGRTISAPLEWFPRLAQATPAQLAAWEPCAAGLGLHWEELDEDISTEGLLRGAPSPEFLRAA